MIAGSTEITPVFNNRTVNYNYFIVRPKNRTEQGERMFQELLHRLAQRQNKGLKSIVIPREAICPIWGGSYRDALILAVKELAETTYMMESTSVKGWDRDFKFLPLFDSLEYQADNKVVELILTEKFLDFLKNTPGGFVVDDIENIRAIRKPEAINFYWYLRRIQDNQQYSKMKKRKNADKETSYTFSMVPEELLDLTGKYSYDRNFHNFLIRVLDPIQSALVGKTVAFNYEAKKVSKVYVSVDITIKIPPHVVKLPSSKPSWMNTLKTEFKFKDAWLMEIYSEVQNNVFSDEYVHWVIYWGGQIYIKNTKNKVVHAAAYLRSLIFNAEWQQRFKQRPVEQKPESFIPPQQPAENPQPSSPPTPDAFGDMPEEITLDLFALRKGLDPQESDTQKAYQQFRKHMEKKGYVSRPRTGGQLVLELTPRAARQIAEK